MRGAHGDPGPEPGPGEIGDLLVGDELAPFEGEDPVCGPGGLLGLSGGEQDRTALVGVRPHDPVQPPTFTDGQPGGGVVQHERVRVGQQGTGQAEAAVHSPRERVQSRLAQADQAHDLQDFVGAPCGQPRSRAQHAQMPSDRAGRVSGHIAEEDAHLAHGVGDAVQGAASEVGDPTALLEFEHEFQRCRLARSGGPEECGDAAGERLEGHIVDGGRKLLAGIAGQSDGLNHLKQDSAVCPFFRAP